MYAPPDDDDKHMIFCTETIISSDFDRGHRPKKCTFIPIIQDSGLSQEHSFFLIVYKTSVNLNAQEFMAKVPTRTFFEV